MAKTTFWRVPHGLKISGQSQNRQKSRKSQSKTDQKMVKNRQKRTKSLQENAILGVKKHGPGCPKASKSAIFRHGEGQKRQNREIPKTASKNIVKSHSPKNKIRGF